MQSTQITVFHGAYILRWSNTGILSGTSVTTVNVSTQKNYNKTRHKTPSVTTVNVSTQKNYNKTRHKTPSVTTVIASTQKILTITTNLNSPQNSPLYCTQCIVWYFCLSQSYK